LRPFDPSRLGLETHYTPKQRQLIQRLILEDWKQSGTKLPTYMKLVARRIMPLKVPDDWLKKLIHQTMSKMLTGQSMPRHTFWACLHLYLMQKYGDIGLISNKADHIQLLGQALSRFAQGNTADMPQGAFALHESAAISLSHEGGYCRIRLTEHQQGDAPYSEPSYQVFDGAVIQQHNDLIGLIRSIENQIIKPFKAAIDQLGPVTNVVLKQRLAQARQPS